MEENAVNFAVTIFNILKPRLLSFNKRGDFNFQFYLRKADLDSGFCNRKIQQKYHGFIRVFSDNGDFTSCYLFFTTEPTFLEYLECKNAAKVVKFDFSFFAYGDRIGKKAQAMPLMGDPTKKER